MGNMRSGSKGNEKSNPTPAGSPKPPEIPINSPSQNSQTTTHTRRGRGFTALERPWPTVGRDGVYRHNNSAPPHVRPADTQFPPQEHSPSAPSGNDRLQKNQSGCMPMRASPTEFPYNLRSYLEQPVERGPWNSVSEFRTHGLGSFGKNTETRWSGPERPGE